jgi:transcriptional regulator with XRE-family HTH domain
MNESAEHFSQRLRESMELAGYEVRPVVLEREFNLRNWGKPVSVQAMRKWLFGKVVPTQDKLVILADWLQVDPHWLRYGEVLHGSVNEQKKRWDLKLNPKEREQLELFVTLPADKRRIIGDIIEAYAKSLK